MKHVHICEGIIQTSSAFSVLLIIRSIISMARFQSKCQLQLQYRNFSFSAAEDPACCRLSLLVLRITLRMDFESRKYDRMYRKFFI